MAGSEKDGAATDNGRKPLLELSTLAPERPYITIDGERYEMALLDDFGLREQAKLSRLQNDINSLQIGERDLGDSEVERLAELLGEMVATIMPSLPDAVTGKLSDYHRLSIIESFMEAAGWTETKPNRRARRRTGAKSSRGSSASTAAGRRTG